MIVKVDERLLVAFFRQTEKYLYERVKTVAYIYIIANWYWQGYLMNICNLD